MNTRVSQYCKGGVGASRGGLAAAIILLVLFACVVLPVLDDGAAHAQMVGPSGFNGVAWDSPLNATPTMAPADTSRGEARFYRRTDESYRPAGMGLTPVVYGYYEGRLRAVYLQLDKDVVTKTVARLNLEYGENRRSTRFGVTTYVWDLGELVVAVKANRNTGAGRLAYEYTPPDESPARAEAVAEALHKTAAAHGYW